VQGGRNCWKVQFIVICIYKFSPQVSFPVYKMDAHRFQKSRNQFTILVSSSYDLRAHMY